MSGRLSLRDLTAEEYATYRVVVRDGYRDDLVTNGGHDPDEATEKALRDTKDVLPVEGPADGQLVKVAELEGRTAGYLWLGRADIPGMAWVQSVDIEPELRGQGLGRELMQLAEQVAAEQGYHRIGLNVMGGNVVATGLYDSLGYTVMHQQMSKDL